jgi:hypothetical protein
VLRLSRVFGRGGGKSGHFKSDLSVPVIDGIFWSYSQLIVQYKTHIITEEQDLAFYIKGTQTFLAKNVGCC